VFLCAAALAACSQPTPGTPRADRASADEATTAAVKRGIEAFQDHFRELGDEHARVYNYLNYGDLKITTEHESFKVDDPPSTLQKRRYERDGDWSETLTPAGSKLDYVKLDENHASLAPTPWVSVPSLFANGFDNCLLLTAWVACQLDSAIGQTNLDAPDEQPDEARSTGDGFEVTTGALLSQMIDGGFISIPEEQRDGITQPMRDTVVPVTIKLDHDMEFTGFEIRATVSDADATPLELQLGYEVLGTASDDDLTEAPAAAEVTAIPDQAAADAFYEKFNDHTPSN
jgi:hypothetical protein